MSWQSFNGVFFLGAWYWCNNCRSSSFSSSLVQYSTVQFNSRSMDIFCWRSGFKCKVLIPRKAIAVTSITTISLLQIHSFVDAGFSLSICLAYRRQYGYMSTLTFTKPCSQVLTQEYVLFFGSTIQKSVIILEYSDNIYTHRLNKNKNCTLFDKRL